MNIDDRQLERQLRRVDIPMDLRASLARIPDGSPSETRRSVRTRQMVAIVLTTAATISVAFFGFRWLGDQHQPGPKNHENPLAKTETLENPNNPSNRADSIGTELMAEIRQQNQQIRELLLSFEIQQLRSKLVASSSLSRETELDRRNRISIILAVANQAALDWGASRLAVDERLLRIKDDYPGTIGAKIAEQFVSNPSN